MLAVTCLNKSHVEPENAPTASVDPKTRSYVCSVCKATGVWPKEALARVELQLLNNKLSIIQMAKKRRDAKQ